MCFCILGPDCAFVLPLIAADFTNARARVSVHRTSSVACRYLIGDWQLLELLEALFHACETFLRVSVAFVRLH